MTHIQNALHGKILGCRKKNHSIFQATMNFSSFFL
uniref:Uncharacterized protein n=1 Tax=Rhizophora mucronata TaxID=61149 RepID=A0A2P2P7K9_RHIMU